MDGYSSALIACARLFSKVYTGLISSEITAFLPSCPFWVKLPSWEAETGSRTCSRICTKFKLSLGCLSRNYLNWIPLWESRAIDASFILLLDLEFFIYFFVWKSFLLVFGGDVSLLASLCFALCVSFKNLMLLSKGLCSSSITRYFFTSRSSVIAFIHRRSSSVGLSFSNSEDECSSLRLLFFSIDRCTRVLLEA